VTKHDKGSSSRRAFNNPAGPLSKEVIAAKIAKIFFIVIVTFSCTHDPALTPSALEGQQASVSTANADDFLIVDCLLPGQIRRLGTKSTYITPQRPVKTTGLDCAIRGGEFVSYDRSNYQTARKIWLAKAQGGDREAQNYLGEIYEKGMGIAPDYSKAAEWYQRAADQGFAPAQINLGKLYETGLGVPKDMQKALSWYRKASGLPDLQPAPELQPDSDIHGTVKPAKDMPAVSQKGPAIEIIKPTARTTRGVAIIPADKKKSTILIIGKVIAPNGLLTLTVNDKETPVDNNDIFKTTVPVEESGSAITIVAIGKTGLRADLMLMTRPVDPSIRQLDFGRYHALVIGNNNHQYLPKLATARSDAQAVSEILEKKYGFTVTSLYDANRYQILSTLNRLRETLTERDNLLIYYAGHGDLDRNNDRGHWLPVDAERESTANWISNVDLTDILNTMSARHVLVIADSCYSGTLTRSVLTQLRPGQTDEVRATYYKAVLKKRSRTALTSGGLAPVLDTGNGGHSVFANIFINVLESNDDVLEGQRLFLDVVARVTAAAEEKRFEQIPQYAPIKFSGHEAGDFFLVPRV
jgi:hypothetical protein